MKAKYAAIILAHYDWQSDTVNNGVDLVRLSLATDGWTQQSLDRLQGYYAYLEASDLQSLADVLHDVTEGVQP